MLEGFHIHNPFHHETPPPAEQFSPEVMEAVNKYMESDIAGKDRLDASRELERLLPDKAERKAAIAAYRIELPKAS